jgi:hypothetical protein
MSFVIAEIEQIEAAAQDLAGIRSSLDEVTEAAAAPTTGIAPAAEDEISAAITALFSNFGEEYQVVLQAVRQPVGYQRGCVSRDRRREQCCGS